MKRRNLLLVGALGIGFVAAWTVYNRTKDVQQSSGTLSSNSTRSVAGETQTLVEKSASASPARTGQVFHPNELSAAAAARWATEYHGSRNYADFVGKAVDAAYAGDGRAAFYIGKILINCSADLKIYGPDKDPEARFEAELAGNKADQWAKDARRDQFQRCIGLSKQDPFRNLPARDGGYPYKYWLSQAVANGDPVAIVDSAYSDLDRVGLADGPSNKTADQVQHDITSAVMSKDGDAIFKAGMLLTNTNYVADPIQGVAMALAGCDLGFDCSSQNPENTFAHCRLNGTCPADADFAYYMQQSLGAEAYARAYARAQQLKEYLANNDQAGVETFTQLKIR